MRGVVLVCRRGGKREAPARRGDAVCRHGGQHRRCRFKGWRASGDGVGLPFGAWTDG